MARVIFLSLIGAIAITVALLYVNYSAQGKCRDRDVKICNRTPVDEMTKPYIHSQ